MGDGRLHLAALDAVIAHKSAKAFGKKDRPVPLACGLVARRAAAPVLNVVREGDPSRSVEVGCVRRDGEWWYQVPDSGEWLSPVEEVERVPGVLVALLERGAR
ncbi:hypothetical protein [Actinomadura sp. 9N407]|uniref:hypothetical protein n=1 Tax=Actinomadura sp. 9N407 TaxID=3375154 RepID=UPI0037B6DB1C